MRTKRLNLMGFTVLRFTNEEVLCTPDQTIDKIRKYINI